MFLGVREKYLVTGDSVQAKGFSKGAYFVGKLAWAKGLDLLFQHMSFVKKRYLKHLHFIIILNNDNTFSSIK